jgi:hypothetical protein
MTALSKFPTEKDQAQQRKDQVPNREDIFLIVCIIAPLLVAPWLWHLYVIYLDWVGRVWQ